MFKVEEKTQVPVYKRESPYTSSGDVRAVGTYDSRCREWLVTLTVRCSDPDRLQVVETPPHSAECRAAYEAACEGRAHPGDEYTCHACPWPPPVASSPADE